VRYKTEIGYPKGRTHNIDLKENGEIQYEGSKSQWFIFKFESYKIAEEIFYRITGISILDN